jgi:carboxyl-terminal processing protease
MKLSNIAICLAVTASIFTAGAFLHARGGARAMSGSSASAGLRGGAFSLFGGSHDSSGGQPITLPGDQSADQKGTSDNSQLAMQGESHGGGLALQGGAPPGGHRGPASAADDATIARVTARILAQDNYAHDLSPAEVSSRTFDEFLDSLDPLHLFLLQSDVDEFGTYRTKLDDMMLQTGDTSTANKIFARFRERFDTDIAYVKELLKNEKFAFTDNSTYEIDRKKALRPKSLEEAQQMWRDRIRYEYLQEKLNNKKPEEIVKTLTSRYSRLSHAIHEYDNDDVLEIYLTSLAHGYDPHSDYLGKSSLANFGIQMKLSFFGIGALLEQDEDYVKIAELTPGGPAIKSGKLKAGDRITAVGQGNQTPVDTAGMKINDVVDMIRGPKGTQVKLIINPADAPDRSVRKPIVLTRDEVKLEEQEAKARLIEMPDSKGVPMRVGVIELPSFYADVDSHDQVHKSTTSDVAKLLKKLKQENVSGVILDLRNNGGGYLSEAISLTGLFIKTGPVVQVKNSDGTVKVDSDKDPAVAYDGPLIVLTNRLSASASEIAAGALQDYGRALIVGDSSTFGKGTVQAVVQLGPILEQNNLNTKTDPGALKLTIQKFYRASGASTQLKGVIPDVILPAMDDVIKVGEKTLDYPLPYDTITSADYTKVNRTEPYGDELRRRSAARIATDSDFVYLRQEIDVFKKMIDSNTVSLNEEQRLREKKEADARVATRKKELLARTPSKEKVYLITLKQADLPGLPAPLAANAANKKKAVDKSVGPDNDLTGSSSDDKLPDIDITLDETKRILTDLITLSTPHTSAQANR